MNNEFLKTTDRSFLHWLVSPANFGLVKKDELKFIVTHALCYQETIRLARTFSTGNFVLDDIKNFKNPQGSRKISEICIFISHFFGRAEVVMDKEKVQRLWNSLPFMNDLLKTLEEHCNKNKVKTLDASKGIQQNSFERNDDDVVSSDSKSESVDMEDEDNDKEATRDQKRKRSNTKVEVPQARTAVGKVSPANSRFNASTAFDGSIVSERCVHIV